MFFRDSPTIVSAVTVAVDIAGLGIVRDQRPVISDATLQIERGSIHVLVGPNGAGKSTLLAAVLGQIAFTGTIQLRFAASGRIAYVPQTFVADRTLPITIAELLALGRQKWPVCFGVRPHARARIDKILDQVGLAGMAQRRLGELSGGELRRVLIGNAIEPAPELLLCDEPATGLDPQAVEQLDAILRTLRDDHGTTVVIVSHDRAQVRRIADRVTLIDRGVKQTGTAAEVMP